MKIIIGLLMFTLAATIYANNATDPCATAFSPASDGNSQWAGDGKYDGQTLARFHFSFVGMMGFCHSRHCDRLQGRLRYTHDHHTFNQLTVLGLCHSNGIIRMLWYSQDQKNKGFLVGTVINSDTIAAQCVLSENSHQRFLSLMLTKQA